MSRTKVKPAPLPLTPAPPKTKRELLADLVGALRAYQTWNARGRMTEWCDNEMVAIAEMRSHIVAGNPAGYRRAAYLAESLSGDRIQQDLAIAMVAARFVEQAAALAGLDPDLAANTLAEVLAATAIADRGRTSVSSDAIQNAARDCQEKGRREAYDHLAQIIYGYRDQIRTAPESREEV